ncbi:MAG: hypothetical protein Q8M07_12275 [Prosthecobacter sp.]|nr:hypothetical protein [Prosthecobacter sp.]
MAFNIPKLLDHSISAIREFASQHPGEHFYAFAIDASLLCLNSEEEFAKKLKSYRDRDARRRRIITDLHEVTAEDMQDFAADMRMDKVDIGNPDDCRKYVLKRHQLLYPYSIQREPSHQSPEHIAALRGNTGDWAYQGFATLTEKDGFDEAAYDTHYYRDGGGPDDDDIDEDDLDDEPSEQAPSEYAVAMNELIERIRNSGALNALKLTHDFYATLVSHNY